MNLSIRTLALVSISLFIWSCGSIAPRQVEPEDINRSPKPQWLINHPVDPNYYLGIGSASKNLSDAEAQKSAQDMALADMASQITVKISSDIVTTLIEKGGITEDEYLATARSQAVADLEGHELLDTWQDQFHHYAYYRLSKAKYAANQARKRQAALLLASDFLNTAERAAAQNNFSESFNATIQAFLPLIPYFNEALEVEFKGERVILSNAVNASLQATLGTIILKPSASNVNGRLGKPITETLGVSATGGNGEPLARLPLRIQFKKGAGVLNESVTTDSRGYGQIQVNSIQSAAKLQTIGISVDLSELISADLSPILKSIINSIPLASTQIIIAVSNPTIYLESLETFNGQALKQLQVEPKLKNHFIQQGFHFVDSAAKADWQMTLNATASEGTVYSGMYTTFADVSLSVIDRNSGAEIYKNSLSRVKGIDLSYSNAANKAFNRAADNLIAAILPEIMMSLK